MRNLGKAQKITIVKDFLFRHLGPNSAWFVGVLLLSANAISSLLLERERRGIFQSKRTDNRLRLQKRTEKALDLCLMLPQFKAQTFDGPFTNLEQNARFYWKRPWLKQRKRHCSLWVNICYFHRPQWTTFVSSSVSHASVYYRTLSWIILKPGVRFSGIPCQTRRHRHSLQDVSYLTTYLRYA